MIRAIIFDLGRVLVPFDFARAYARIEALGGRPPSLPIDLTERFESGEIETADFIREICAYCAIDVSPEAFDELWNCIFTRDELIPESLVESLSRRYRMVLLSNTNPPHFAMLKREYPILGHFHAYVLSYEVGAMKPSAGCRPEECFFTDDIAAYVEGAKEHGIDAVQFLSAAQIKAELQKRDVRF